MVETSANLPAKQCRDYLICEVATSATDFPVQTVGYLPFSPESPENPQELSLNCLPVDGVSSSRVPAKANERWPPVTRHVTSLTISLEQRAVREDPLHGPRVKLTELILYLFTEGGRLMGGARGHGCGSEGAKFNVCSIFESGVYSTSNNFPK